MLSWQKGVLETLPWPDDFEIPRKLPQQERDGELPDPANPSRAPPQADLMI